MKNITIHTTSKKLLSDFLTPINIYLKLRDVPAGSILLESSDYHGQENSLSIICCEPIASFTVNRQSITEKVQGSTLTLKYNFEGKELVGHLDAFRSAFKFSPDFEDAPAAGLFGYTNYDAVRFFEDVSLASDNQKIPDLCYQLFGFVLVIDHFSNELTVYRNSINPTSNEDVNQIIQLVRSSKFTTYPFQKVGKRKSNLSDEEFLNAVKKGIAHCHAGDVFQIVLSRRFEQTFTGDEFNVYRALRSVNPSPYLFYFDYTAFRIFGSSPEAQLQVKGNTASIFPIAGTVRRTGNDAEDALLAEKLAADEKENAEHLMLVDLARNDLSRVARKVRVEVLREIQYYSHVIHLVSKVTGTLPEEGSSLKLFADSFPAGTLSGAPKIKAMNLIAEMEKGSRGFYGGAIGYLGCNGSINHAIMIRSFLSQNNTLISQAGAGVVAKSVPENELAEVNNKLEALRRAVAMAETI